MLLVFLSRCVLRKRLPGPCLGHGARKKQVPGELVRVCQAHALATLRTEDETIACSRLQLRKCGQTLRKAQRVTTQGRLPLAPGQACSQ